MARPVAVLIPALAFLLILGTPFLRLEQGIPDASILPRGIESREAAVALSEALPSGLPPRGRGAPVPAVALSEEFPSGETSPIIVLATVDGSPTDAANVQRILDYS